jgi:ribose-phosphate pyrophosphokinase
MDLHAGQIQGFFSIPGDVLTAFYLLVDYIRTKKDEMEKPVVVTADLGFAKKARNYAQALNLPLAFIEKRRLSNDARAEALTLIGDVYERDCIIVDDEVDTGGSISQAVNLVKDSGARNIYVSFVHPVLSSSAAERMGALPVKEFITTDSIPLSEEKRARFGNRLTTLTIAPLLGEVIWRVNAGVSVGALFNE